MRKKVKDAEPKPRGAAKNNRITQYFTPDKRPTVIDTHTPKPEIESESRGGRANPGPT